MQEKHHIKIQTWFHLLAKASSKSIGWINKISHNRLLQRILNLSLLGFIVAYLVRYSPGIVAELRGSYFNIWWLLASCLLTWLIVWSGAAVWWLLLLGFRQPAPWLDSWRSHLKGSIAKYIPGFAWQYISKAYLTRQMGASVKVIGALLTLEFVLLLWTGLCLGFLFAQGSIITHLGLQSWVSEWLRIIGGVMLVILVLLPFAAPRIISHTPFADLVLCKKHLFLSVLVILSGWLALGLSLWMLSIAFGFPNLEKYPFFVFALTISLLGGILMVPVPNGLGVREGIMIYLLSFVMPTPIAVIVAAVSRLEIVTGELFWVLMIELLRQISYRKHHNSQKKGILRKDY